MLIGIEGINGTSVWLYVCDLVGTTLISMSVLQSYPHGNKDDKDYLFVGKLTQCLLHTLSLICTDGIRYPSTNNQHYHLSRDNECRKYILIIHDKYIL